MNAPVAPRRSRWPRFLFWSAAVFLASLAIVAIAAVNVVTLSRDAITLREALTAGISRDLQPRVQISVGPATLAFARLAVACIDDVPDEAREALRAVRSASVGVYAIDCAGPVAARGGLLTAADRTMAARGWARIVGVRDGTDDLVVVYLPADGAVSRTQRFCVAVRQRDQLVVVAGAADAEMLVDLAERHRDRITL